jgi:hypothetical protein
MLFRLLLMVCGKHVLKVVDQFSSLVLMVIMLFYLLIVNVIKFIFSPHFL